MKLKPGIYTIANEQSKLIQISMVKNPVAFMARQAELIKLNMHPCGISYELQYGALEHDYNQYELRYRHRELCLHWKKMGYKVIGAKRLSQYKYQYKVMKNKVMLRIVDSRNIVIWDKQFDLIDAAKKFAKDNSIETILRELS